MRICMVLYDPQGFGGLEEYAVTLAVGLKQQGHEVSVLSTHWTPSDNQYTRFLRENGVTTVQPPRWLSLPASNWPTKERILAGLMWLATPLTFVLAAGLSLFGHRSWQQARVSANGWVHGQLLTHLIGPDRWQSLGRLLLNWWKLRWQPDLLHIQGYTTTLLFAIDWAYARQMPVVYEEHQTPDAQFDWWQGFQHSINKATIVVAVSEKSAEGLRSICGVTRPIVVRSPLLPDPAASGWQANGDRQGRAMPLQVTSTARLAVAKGLTYLCEAIAQVKMTHPTVQFRVYGDGDMRQELLAYAKKLGLDGNAIFVGPYTSRQELSRIMKDTDIFVMSSILEGQPLSLVEAMAYGRPIVTTTVGGIPELITDGANGLLCAPADPACLAQKLRVLLDQPELRDRLGHAARQTYEQGPFQPTAVCNYFEKVYQEALQQGQNPASDDQTLVPTFDVDL